MDCIRETTFTDKRLNHTYLLDGTKMVAFVPVGERLAKYFKSPIEFSRRGRQFVLGDRKLFAKTVVKSNLVKVLGSKPGTFYFIDPEKETCSCSGFMYRGHCKHWDKYKN